MVLSIGFIYKITNAVNDKIYVGATQFSLTKRFKEHVNDSKRERCKDRLLYSAMNQYGVDKFCITLLEEVENCCLFDREQYWVEHLQSHKHGYNATYGGAGKCTYNHDKIISLYQQTNNITKVAQLTGCDEGHVSEILKSNEIGILSSGDVVKRQHEKRVIQMDKHEIALREFPTQQDAVRWLYDHGYTTNKNHSAGHKISLCARGERKTAYGFKWKIESAA